MKKFICAILTSALLLASVTPAFAAGSIKVSESAFADIMAEFGNNMPDDPNQRIRIWKTFKTYMGDGIETLIGCLNGTITPPSDDLQMIFDKYVNGIKDKYADEFIFFLELYNATLLEDRLTALDNFGSNAVLKPDGTYTEIEKTPLPISAEAKEASEAIFSTYVSDETLAGFDFHEIDTANLLNLVTPFKGRFKMTEDSDGNFVLARGYDTSFARRLGKSMNYTSINGVKIDSTWDDSVKGYKILTGIVGMFNTVDDEVLENGVGKKENLKVVLADPEINLFEKGLREAEDITPTDPDDSGDEKEDVGGGSSSSGSSGIYRPNRNPNSGVFELDEPTYDKSKDLFSDVAANSWAVPYVMNLTERKIFIGYEDGTFRPDISISRQEIAVALVRAMGLAPDAAVADAASGFTDDSEIAEWARGYVNIAVEKKIFTGYDDGEFKPTRTISRQELATVLMRLSGDTTTAVTMNYGDAAEIQDYAKAHIGRATTLGIVGGYPDGTFKPFNEVTRAEAAKMLYGGLEYYNYVVK